MMINEKAFIAAALSILVIGTIFFGLFSNSWLTWSEEREFYEWEVRAEVNIGLREMEAKVIMNDDEVSQIYQLEDLEEEEDQLNAQLGTQEKGWEDLNSVGLAAYFLLWASLALVLAFIVFAILAGLGIFTSRIGMVLGFMAGGSILIGTLYYGIFAPRPSSLDGIGLGMAFFVVLIGGIVQLGASFLMRWVKKP